MDRAETITTELERVGELAEAVFAHVEDVFAVVAAFWRAIGDDELGESGAAHDGPAVVADVVQNESVARVEADRQCPLVPGDGVAVHGEADAFGLDGIEGLERRARGGEGFGIGGESAPGG